MKSYTDMLFLSTFSSEYQLDPSEAYRRANQPAAASSTAPPLSQFQRLACMIPCRRLACILVGVPHLDCRFSISLPLPAAAAENDAHTFEHRAIDGQRP
jgi:hypothetical protein